MAGTAVGGNSVCARGPEPQPWQGLWPVPPPEQTEPEEALTPRDAVYTICKQAFRPASY